MPMLPMLGPVEKLAKLLADSAQLDEKIHDAMDALMLIKNAFPSPWQRWLR
jgi:hypothetical protein